MLSIVEAQISIVESNKQCLRAAHAFEFKQAHAGNWHWQVNCVIFLPCEVNIKEKRETTNQKARPGKRGAERVYKPLTVNE